MLSPQSRNFIKNKRVLITGAAGSIGSELARQLSKLKPKKLLLLDQNEGGIFDLWQELPEAIPIIADIRNNAVIQRHFKKYKPEIVFHCAAYKNVPLMEMCGEEAFETNVIGFSRILAAAEKNEVQKLIFVSTDKAVNPISEMGKSKKLAEELCQKHTKISVIIVRFGNVLASQGSVIPIFWRQIEKNEALTITDPRMERYSMTIFEACELLIESSYLGQSGQTFVFDMGNSIKIIELAEQMIRLSGKNLPIKIIGIRPGEKLKEKLISKNEELVGTLHPKILRVVRGKERKEYDL